MSIDVRAIRTKKAFKEFSEKLDKRGPAYVFLKKGHTYKAFPESEFQTVLVNQGWVLVATSQDF